MSRRSDSGLNGVVLIDKPGGWTSHDVVAKCRRLFGQRRIGHTGTLDPMATGLLVLCLGRATRLVEYAQGHDKRYTGTITLGRTTTTDDAEGETLREIPLPALPAEALESAVATFRGEIEQLPPAYSALKVGGRKAYDLARRGEVPALAPRRVTIHRIEAHLSGAGTIGIDVSCSAGTYIRSLARDLGERLGCGAHLSGLRRHRAGPFRIEDATSMEALEALSEAERAEFVLPEDSAVEDMDAALLSSDGVAALAVGGPWLARAHVERGSAHARIYDGSGEFVAVASVSSSGEIRPLKVFRSGNSGN